MGNINKGNIAVVGSTMIDMVTFTHNIPQGGQTVSGDKFLLGFGGKGANQAVMLGRFGQPIYLVNALGTDVFGDSYISQLALENINTQYIARVEKPSGVASIWVEPKKRIDQEMIEEIREFLREFFTLFDIDHVSVFFTQDEDIPTPTVILRSLRIIAPCSAASLSRSLEEKRYKVPNEVWMAHALDRLRKAGSVVRKANGQFFLSLEGLRRLGTEKSRASPDVKRALALGKKDS